MSDFGAPLWLDKKKMKINKQCMLDKPPLPTKDTLWDT